MLNSNDFLHFNPVIHLLKLLHSAHLTCDITVDPKLKVLFRAGDLLALNELCDFPAAFSQVDENGCYPLHRAAGRPLLSVLELVLYGE